MAFALFMGMKPNKSFLQITGLVIVCFSVLIAGNAVSDIIGKASDIIFAPEDSGLSSQNVQAAIDEADARLVTVETRLQQLHDKSCPSGMSLITNLKRCIDTSLGDNGFNTTFKNASDACQNQGKRLCSPQELYSACKQSGLLSDVLSGDYEWSNQYTSSNHAVAMLNTSCENTHYAQIIDTVGKRFRCCQ